MSVAALIPAAGSGTRLGQGPKAWVEVGGTSLLARAVDALQPFVDEVLVALPEGMARPVGLPARSIVGGPTRQASVLALLRATGADTVLIHDAARPFLPVRVIQEVLDAARGLGAATAALPCPDTLVRGEAGHWAGHLPREEVWAVQTPQGFRRALLLEAHERALTEGWAATDDAGLVARLGAQVRLVPGDARLFKVTTAGDLELARAFAIQWDQARPGAPA